MARVSRDRLASWSVFVIAIVGSFVVASIDLGFDLDWRGMNIWRTFAGVALAGSLAWAARGTRRRATTDYRQDMYLLREPGQSMWAVIVVVALLLVPFALASGFDPPMDYPWSSWFKVLNIAIMFAVGGAAFNLLVGYAGQISFAHAAFLVLGTMVSGTLGPVWGWPYPVAIGVATLSGALIGVIVGLPALRLRGLYLLLATLGVHFVFVLAWSKWLLRYFGFDSVRFEDPVIPTWLHWLPFINPEDGVFALDSDFRWYWVIMPVCTAALIVMVNVVRTREGRAFAAVRQHDISASLIGINVARSKLLAFALSSAFVAMVGAMGSYYIGVRGEDSFPLLIVLDYSIIIVVGGFSSIQGAIFGSFFFFGGKEFSGWIRAEVWGIRDVDWIQTNGPALDLAVFGALVVAVLVLKPDGLTGFWKDVKGWFAKWPYSV